VGFSPLYIAEFCIMTATNKIARNNRVFNIVYIVLIVVLIILAVGGSILADRFVYVAGTRNDTNYSMIYGFEFFIMLLLIMAPIAVGASIVAMISLVLRHRNVGEVLLRFALIPLGPFIVCCAFLYASPLSAVFLEGFEQWVRQEVDIDSIQTWLVNEGAKHAGQHYVAEAGFPEDLPKCLIELSPVVISFVNYDSQNGPNVEISWFLFKENYGLIIGPPEMETSEEERIEPYTGGSEFRRPIKPGAYVFIRG
jgi:hypothetical protein